MTKMVTRADGQVTYVSEEFLDSVVQEGDTVEDMPVLERQEPTAEEIANNQVYFARHIPSLNEVSKKGEDVLEVEKILNYFTEILLGNKLK